MKHQAWISAAMVELQIAQDQDARNAIAHIKEAISNLELE